MASVKVRVQAICGVPNAKGYILKIQENGNTHVTNKCKKDLLFNDSFTISLSPSTNKFTVSIFDLKENMVSTGKVNLTNLTNGRTETVWYPLSDNTKVCLSVLATGLVMQPTIPEASGNAGENTSASKTIPISTERLDAIFNLLLDDMGLNPEARTNMLALSAKNKYELIVQKKLVDQVRDVQTTPAEQLPIFWINKLKSEPNEEVLGQLYILLSHELVTWIKEFHDQDGLNLLGNLLSELNAVEKKTSVEVARTSKLVQCLRAFMDNQAGLDMVINQPKILSALASVIPQSKVDHAARIQALVLLSVVAVSPSGYDRVIGAMNDLKECLDEPARFSSIVSAVKKTKDKKLRVVLMTFINVICNTPDYLDRRRSMRQEFDHLEFEKVLDTLRKADDSLELDQQIHIYDDEKEQDEEVLRRRFDHVSDVKLDDMDMVFQRIKSMVDQACLSCYFKVVMHSLLSIRVTENDVYKHQWGLCAKATKAISDMKMKVEPSMGAFLDLLVKSIDSEVIDVLPLKQEIDVLNASNNENLQRFKTKEIELKERNQEIQALKNAIVTMQQARPSSQFLSSPFVDISNSPLPRQPSTTEPDASLPPPATESEASGGPPPPPPPPGMSGGPPPPPPPGMSGGGPPPPPGMGGGPPRAMAVARKRPEVLPKAKVRNFQWVKLPENKVTGTFFGNFDLELKDFTIDYELLESHFCVQDMRKGSTEPEKKKEVALSLMDPKTSQNLSIFINFFKQYKYSQVSFAILQLDETIISPQQLGNFMTVWPSAEDVQQITDYLSSGGDLVKLAPAEQFVAEINTVPNVLARLKAFRFKVEFETRKSEVKPSIEVLNVACHEVKDNVRIGKLFEIILHIGNFLNAGTNKGQAWGFKLGDLRKLAEAKTTDNKSNLLTILVQLLEKSQPDLLEFYKDLGSLQAAQRINLQQLQSELSKLTKELQTIKSSIETVQSMGSHDLFHQKMSDFVSLTEKEVEKMNDDLSQVTKTFETLVSYYVEDPKTMGTEEFFSLFTGFAKSVEDTVKKLEAARLAEEKALKRGVTASSKKPLAPAAKSSAAGQAVVNELFGQLASGNPFKNRRKASSEVQEQEQLQVQA